MLEGIGLFRGIMTKMNWLDQNQRVISENVANSDTPGYQPKTLKPVDFKSYMGKSGTQIDGRTGIAPVRMTATEPGHIGFGEDKSKAAEIRQKKVYESSPDDNGVILEQQLYNANLNSMDYQLATNLYRRNVGMLRMAIQGSR